MAWWFKKKVRDIPKIYSAWLLAAVPCTFIVGWGCFLTLLKLLQTTTPPSGVWLTFTAGGVGAVIVLCSFDLLRTRTLLHELKHALVIILTGNVVKGIYVSKSGGSVNYEMAQENFHAAPIISLAPYFFPLLSLPTLIVCCIFGAGDPQGFAFALGATLAIDLQTAFSEMRPEQTDFRKVLGGFFASALYLAGFHFMWVTVCLLWVQGGVQAYPEALLVLLSGLMHIAKQVEPHAREIVHKAAQKQ